MQNMLKNTLASNNDIIQDYKVALVIFVTLFMMVTQDNTDTSEKRFSYQTALEQIFRSAWFGGCHQQRQVDPKFSIVKFVSMA